MCIAAGAAVGAIPSWLRLIESQRDAKSRYPHLRPRLAARAARDNTIDLLKDIALFTIGFAFELYERPPTKMPTDALVERLRCHLKTKLGDEGPPQNPKEMTVSEYLQHVWSPHRSKARSWSNESGLWRLHLIPRFGAIRMSDLTHPDFDDFIENLTLQNGNPASGNTKRLVRAAYKAMLTHAMRKGHIDEIHPFFHIKGSTKSTRPVDHLTPDELRAVLQAASPLHRALFAVATMQGLRPSEVTQLRWEHLDLNKGHLFAPGTKTKDSAAHIPLFDGTRVEIAAWWERCRRPQTGWMFPRTAAQTKDWRGFVYVDGPPMASAGSFKRALARAVELAGISKRITPYSLRHSFATAASVAGASVDDVAKVMRHSSPEMVRRRYDHSGATGVDRSRFPDW